MDGSSAPQSVADVEELVKQLYRPAPAKVISQVSDQLQALQRSPEGWQIADALMGSDDSNVRFFAALTFQVKLNNDGPSLDTETAQTVQSRIISWLARLSTQGEGTLVTKKLCSTLTTYFLRSTLRWEKPLSHVAVSLRAGDAISGDSSRAQSSLTPSLTDLPDGQIMVLLWLAATIADEVSRIDSNSAASAQIHIQMEAIVKDASALIAAAFARPHTRVRAEGLRTFLTWVNYAQPVWPSKPEALQYLRNLIEPAAQAITDQSLQHDALDVFRDILENYTSFFQPQHMELLGRLVCDYLQPPLLQALQDGNPESLPYGQMVIAYGTANIQDIVGHAERSEVAQTIIKLHFDILQAPGYPGDDDELSIFSIEFWNTYIEYANDAVFSLDIWEPRPPWEPYVRSVMTRLVELVCAKMRMPPSQIAKDWTDAENEGFREFRLDAADLLSSVYVFLAKDMLRQLVTLTLRCLEAKQWRAVEAALFCLHALADNVVGEETGDDILSVIFSSSLFREVGDFSQNIPSQVRRTVIDALGSYGQYIERHAEYLPDALRFLFASLETTLAGPAAKSIASLCSACRASLTSELDGFLRQYQNIRNGPTSDRYTQEKVIGAIAAIVQALKPEGAKVEPLLALIENVEEDVQVAKDSAAAGDHELAELTGVTALKCLASIGKGMQVPDNVPINIYDDDDAPSGLKNFWEGEEAQAVQQRIMGCFSVLSVIGNDGDAIEAACQVLRTGFAEAEPGPFVLPPSITVSFLQQCSINTPQLETVLATACILIKHHSKTGAKRIPDEVRAICEQVASFIQQLGQPSRDPGVAQGCIDILCCLTPLYTYILFEDGSQLAQRLPFVLNVTLQAIDGQDSFPKRSASEFWTELVKQSSKSLAGDMQMRVGQVIAVYGGPLALTLMRQIGGLAQRSELDHLCDSLKALITTQSKARAWLEAALFSDAFPAVNERVGEAEKRRFLQQLVAVRGDTWKTRDVAKEFWAACRGTIGSF